MKRITKKNKAIDSHNHNNKSMHKIRKNTLNTKQGKVEELIKLTTIGNKRKSSATTSVGVKLVKASVVKPNNNYRTIRGIADTPTKPTTIGISRPRKKHSKKTKKTSQ